MSADSHQSSRGPTGLTLILPFIRHAMRRAFCGVWVAGAENLPPDDCGRPLLACAGHTNWWDGFAAALVTRRLADGRRFAAMQEARHFAKTPFFRLAGVFAIDLEGSPLGGFREALLRLQNPRAILWMFPQGEFAGADEPVIVRKGAARLAARSGALIVPVWFHYPWLFESRPALVVEIGKAMEPAEADRLGGALEALRVSEAWRKAPEEGRAILAPALSLNKVWELWGRRLGLIRGNQRFEPWNR